MKLHGTPFQIKVWNEIKKIPKGKVATYKEIAI
ncbi:MAG TPA: 6-O-methylguanine DNA methyltransferase, partial [Methylophilaceae bacterium]|nr:6-O-methylguanine DNA methyltransferase [Methylophilaceae bacterium]